MCQPLYLRITFISKVTLSKLSNSSCRGFKLQKGANPRTIILFFFVVGHEREHCLHLSKKLEPKLKYEGTSLVGAKGEIKLNLACV